MADIPNGNGRPPEPTKGAQAYRWAVTGGLAILGVLSYRVLVNVDDMARDVRQLQIQVTQLTSTLANLTAQIASADRRNDTQDIKINEVERRVWQLAPQGNKATP